MKLDDDNYKQELASAKLPVLLFFKGTFCGPSAWFQPLIDKAEEDYAGKVHIAQIDVEECPRLTREYLIKGTPTALVLKGREPVASRIGTMRWSEFSGFINDSLAKEAKSNAV